MLKKRSMGELDDSGFFSGITEDYSNYRWYKGEEANPYQGDTEKPLAAAFWEYEKEFYMKYLDKADASISLAEAYKQWKAEFVQEYLPGKSNPYGDDTNWLQVFENGKR